MTDKMFSEEELRSAAEKVRSARLSQIPDEIPEHKFSEEFEEEIAVLSKKKQRRQSCHTGLRRAMAAVLTLVVGMTLAFTLNTNARASLMSWTKRVSKRFETFSFKEEPSGELPMYTLSWIPEGYEYATAYGRGEFVDNEMQLTNYILIYQMPDDADMELQFLFGSMRSDMSLSIDLEGAEYDTSYPLVNGCYGELQISLDPEIKSGLIWFDEEAGIYFGIFGFLGEEELLHIAEGVILEDSTN